MPKTARNIMTSEPVRCSPTTTLDQVARLMAQHDCGEIPVVDSGDRPIGVITDRDIVCRVVADGKNPLAYTAGQFMSQPVVTVDVNAPLDTVRSTMERHQIRRVPVVDQHGTCVGIIAQADIARTDAASEVGELVREVSRETSGPSR